MLTPVVTKQSSSEALKKRAGKNRNKWQEDNEYFPFLLIILFNKIIQSTKTFVLDWLIISFEISCALASFIPRRQKNILPPEERTKRSQPMAATKQSSPQASSKAARQLSLCSKRSNGKESAL